MRAAAFAIAAWLLVVQSWAQPAAMPAAEFTWPTTSTKVIIKNREVACSWRDGQPWASYRDVQSLLGLSPSDEPSINLVSILSEKGYLIRQDPNGTIIVEPPAPMAANQYRYRQTPEEKAAYAARVREKNREWSRNNNDAIRERAAKPGANEPAKLEVTAITYKNLPNNGLQATVTIENIGNKPTTSTCTVDAEFRGESGIVVGRVRSGIDKIPAQQKTSVTLFCIGKGMTSPLFTCKVRIINTTTREVTEGG